jgi:hypothetical protein
LLTVTYYGSQDTTSRSLGLPLPLGSTSPRGLQVIGVVTDVPSGSDCAIVWQDLALLTPYEWCVAVSDENSTTVGPAWHFTTESDS